MAKITALSRSKGRGGRLDISLDNRYAFSLTAEVAVSEGIKVGQELSQGQIRALSHLDRFQHCYDAASRLLSYRPRSESELRERLFRRRFDADSVAKVLARLKEQGLVDDAAFARFWRDNRTEFSPRSRHLIRLELRQKKVSNETIDQVVAALDEDENAYRAARSKADRLSLSEEQLFRRRLSDYLRRRGFNYGVIKQTVTRLWLELGVSQVSDCLDTKLPG